MGIPDEGEFEENGDDTPFVYSHGITQTEAERRLIIYGRNELPEKKIPRWLVQSISSKLESTTSCLGTRTLTSITFKLLSYVLNFSVRYIFIEQLWQPMPIMIWIAAIVEAATENFPDMAILLFIQFANASIGFYEITKAGDAVAALKASLQASKAKINYHLMTSFITLQ